MAGADAPGNTPGRRGHSVAACGLRTQPRLVDPTASEDAVCAGFLLRGAGHNLAVRVGRLRGKINADVIDGGRELHDSYRSMAVANGVASDEPVLSPCRD